MSILSCYPGYTTWAFWRFYACFPSAALRWVHFIAIVDEAGNATLYRNGIETKTGFNTSLPKSVNRSLNRIANSVYVEHVPAAMQDVRVYNRPLSDEEIESLSGGVPTSGLRIMS